MKTSSRLNRAIDKLLKHYAAKTSGYDQLVECNILGRALKAWCEKGEEGLTEFVKGEITPSEAELPGLVGILKDVDADMADFYGQAVKAKLQKPQPVLRAAAG